MATQDHKWPNRTLIGQAGHTFSVDAAHEQAALSRRCQVFYRKY